MLRHFLKGTGIAAAIGAAALAAPAAHAVQDTTQVQINFPQVLILYTYDQIVLDVTAATLAGQLGVTGATCTTGAYCVELAGPTIPWDMANPADANIAGGAAPLPNLNALNVNITNAWGVRSVAAAGGLTASITGPANLSGPGAALPVSAVATSNTAPGRGMGSLTGTRVGNISFTLDASPLDTEGAYTGNFVINVVSP